MSVKIRRITAFLLALSLLCILAVQTAFAAPVAADYKFEGGSVTVDGTEDKTVDVNFISVKGDEYSAFQADWSKKELEDTSYFTLTALTPGGTASPMEDDPNTGHTYWVEGTFNAPIVVAAGGTIWKATYTVAKDTPSGTYTFSLKVPSIADGSFDGADVGTFTAAVTVTNTTPAAVGYTVAVSGNTTIQTDGEAEVKLNITHSDANETSYAAYSMKVSYNKDVLTYKSFSDADATVTDDGNGNLTIYRYGKDLTLGQNLTLSFAGKAGGTGEVKVTEAKIDKSENALKDAPAATVTGSATITVGQTYTVNRDANVVDGNPKAEAGKDYTFKLTNGLDGNCMTVSYTIGGVDKGTLTQGADGSYTIPAGEITGDITITAVGKKFDVTVDTTASGAGNVTLTDGSKATYGTNYTFTLTPEANYAYTVTVTAGGKTVTPALDADGKIYTINGTDITGNVVITVTKEANKAQINFAGSGSADVVNGSASQIVEPGQEFKFSIHKEDGYAYTVTAAKANDTTVTVTDNGDGTYTIAGAAIAAGDVITVTVEKNLIEAKYTIEVNEFVKLDANAEGKAQSVFLITAKLNGDAKLADGKVLAYGNNAMFQNAERYDGAYAYLVISDKTLDEVKAEAEKAGQITEVDGTAQTFSVNGDVNGTELVDINDAQLVYNIYNAKYDSFETTTMKMFLAADVNKDREVSALDAAAVVALIK